MEMAPASNLAGTLNVRMGVNWGLSAEQLRAFYRFEYAHVHNQTWQHLTQAAHSMDNERDPLWELMVRSNHWLSRAKLYHHLQPPTLPAKCGDLFFTDDNVHWHCGVPESPALNASLVYGFDKLVGSGPPKFIVHVNLAIVNARGRLRDLADESFVVRPVFHPQPASSDTWSDLSEAVVVVLEGRARSELRNVTLPVELSHLQIGQELTMETFPPLSQGDSVHQAGLKLTQAVLDAAPAVRLSALKLIVGNYPMLHGALEQIAVRPPFEQLCRKLSLDFPSHCNYLLMNGVDFDADAVDLHQLLDLAVSVKTGGPSDKAKAQFSHSLGIPNYAGGKGGREELVCPQELILAFSSHQPTLLRVQAVLNPLSRPFPALFLLLWKLNRLELLSGQLCLNPGPLAPDYPLTAFYAIDHAMPILMPPEARLALRVHTPHAWLTIVDDRSNADLDVDNVSAQELSSKDSVFYVLKHMVWEGQVWAHDANDSNLKLLAPSGTPVQMVTMTGLNDHITHVNDNANKLNSRVLGGKDEAKEPKTDQANEEASTIETVIVAEGYFQLKVPSGVHKIRALGREQQIVADTLSPRPLQLALVAEPSKEISYVVPRVDPTIVNVVALVSGRSYERMALAMMLSVRQNLSPQRGRPLKFWFFEQFASPSFRRHAVALCRRQKCDVDFVSYQRPSWLWPQRRHMGHVLASKILGLDLALPRHVARFVLVDADQVARGDLGDLQDTDLGGRVYGMVPFCDNLAEAEPFAFWRHNGSYWRNVLRGRPYFIGALVVVDLDKFRQEAAGDALRQHYQKLAAQPNSLHNMDQDLVNSLQNRLPVHQLSSEWLWCESWCGLEAKSRAKIIDLCTNPRRREDKLTNARRVIDEWDALDRQVQKILIDDPLGDKEDL